MRRFYCPEIDRTTKFFSLDREQSDHVRSVLRMRTGDELQVFDGNGFELLCTIANIGAKREAVELSVVSEAEPPSRESELDLTLCAAILKSDKFDFVIQKAVELGVRRFQPLVTARCDADARHFSKKAERYQRIIIESSKQCGRAVLMKIEQPVDFSKAFSSDGTSILFYESGGNRFSDISASKKITAFVGPEGGWDSSEIELANENNVKIINLGGRILRAETAAIVAAALLQHRFGDLN